MLRRIYLGHTVCCSFFKGGTHFVRTMVCLPPAHSVLLPLNNEQHTVCRGRYTIVTQCVAPYLRTPFLMVQHTVCRSRYAIVTQCVAPYLRTPFLMVQHTVCEHKYCAVILRVLHVSVSGGCRSDRASTPNRSVTHQHTPNTATRTQCVAPRFQGATHCVRTQFSCHYTFAMLTH